MGELPFPTPLHRRLHKPEILDKPNYLVIGEMHHYSIKSKYKIKIQKELSGITVGIFEFPVQRIAWGYKTDRGYRKTGSGMLYFYCSERGIPIRSIEEFGERKNPFIPLLRKYKVPEAYINFYGLSEVLVNLLESETSDYLVSTGFESFLSPEIMLLYQRSDYMNFDGTMGMMRNVERHFKDKIGIDNTFAFVSFLAETFFYPFLAWEKTIRHKEIWEPRVRSFISTFPPKRAYQVGRGHVNTIEKIEEGEPLPEPVDWELFRQSLIGENKQVFDELNQLLTSV